MNTHETFGEKAKKGALTLLKLGALAVGVFGAYQAARGMGAAFDIPVLDHLPGLDMPRVEPPIRIDTPPVS